MKLWSALMSFYEDPVTPLRQRFPAGPAVTGPAPVPMPAVPFAVRYGVPQPIFEAKHGRPPTRTTVCNRTSMSGDGAGKAPTPDDTQVVATD